MTHIDFKLNAIDGNGPVVEPMNFELGIIEDRELETMLHEGIDKGLTPHGAQTNGLTKTFSYEEPTTAWKHLF